jgi:hypothetical protein
LGFFVFFSSNQKKNTTQPIVSGDAPLAVLAASRVYLKGIGVFILHAPLANRQDMHAGMCHPILVGWVRKPGSRTPPFGVGCLVFSAVPKKTDTPPE